MQKWNLGRGDPLTLTMACDARLGSIPVYTDDQIWDLSLGTGEPPAISLETTYGLRARSMRIFPRFSELNSAITDPQIFHQPPRVHQFYPNYSSITYAPFVGIDVVAEYWVPSSQTVAGRIQITNTSIVPRQIRFELVTLLNPLDDGECMGTHSMGITPVLIGKTGDICPVLFLTGGPESGSGPYPSLYLDLELLPGNQRQFTWSLASLGDPEASFELARQTTARRWDAEHALIQRINHAHQLEIYTGDPDWDAALALSQKIGYSLFIGPGEHLPYQSIVQTRTPDQGYSRRSDGSDYNHLWNGQTALDIYYLLGIILPGGGILAQGLLCNFLATQSENGWIDWKPGIAGQRGRLHAQPLLANLTWRIFESTRDRDFLSQVYPALLQYLDVWFDPQHDRDQDGVPEWDHPLQSGLEDNPIFDRWHADGKGLEINVAEDPALIAFLVQECNCLIRIAEQLNQIDAVQNLNSRIQTLRQAAEDCWDARQAIYRIRDRDTHTWPRSKVLAKASGTANLKIKQNFDTPSRLQIRIQSTGETTRTPTIHIFGQNQSGAIEEHILNRGVIWIQRQAMLTSQQVFTEIDRIEIEGLAAKDRITVRLADYTQETIAGLLPLWGRIPDAKRARRLVEKTIFHAERFGLPYGLPAFPSATSDSNVNTRLSVNPVWNSLIGEGLVSYGFTQQAVRLVSSLMAAAIQSLKSEGVYRQAYRADTGEGIGECNSLQGLAPLGLFLEVLGVQILSPTQLILHGNNPYPWPVTIKYRGLTVVRRDHDTWITFPDGQTARSSGPGSHLVSLS